MGAEDFEGVEGVAFGPEGARVRSWAALGADKIHLARSDFFGAALSQLRWILI